MTLSGTPANAAPGLIGFDWDTRLNPAQAKQYAAKGYRFCIRYVSRDAASRAANEKNGTPDLSADEAAGILGAGMALMAVQHVEKPGWTPTQALGQTYGENAASYASDAGLPGGINLWLDLEEVNAGTPKPDIFAYCNAWFHAVSTAGFIPGIYVGANSQLSSDDLYLDLATRHYWRAPGKIPDVSHRGYQLLQHTSGSGQTEFDRDVTQTDALGGCVIWLAPA